ncbi:MAG TPA: NosD domain-containing protein [Candidatus Acidoferrum sp.]|nr:NosD domain-containing protein [Candidatus Acidoferrum sp.]
MSVSVHIPLVKAWNGTIYINVDGSVDPPSAPIQQNGNVYTLTDNISTTSDGIVIERNDITLDGSHYTIQGNGNSNENGIDMNQTSYVTVQNTNIENFSIGIFAPQSEYDTITGNTIAQNSLGMWIDSSSNINVIGNNIQQNSVFGIWLTSSSNVDIYHNNFVNNVAQVYTDSINTWDAGYPIGGNYWSDYAGSDLYSGPFQNQTGSDGIGDSPYIINVNNVDNYPLIGPLVHDVGITDVYSAKTIVGQGLTMNITLQVVNYGAEAETVSVMLNVGSIIVNTWSETLPAQTFELLNYTWTAFGIPRGNYTIGAYAPPVSGETLTADNNFTDSSVIVSLIGDLTGPTPFVPDGKVDIRDISVVAKCFGSLPGMSNWNANCDLNNDGKIDIRDISMVAKHFGQSG